jgi:putative toxin-antitoxin system antitoxin component (TIGR02293 family)
LPIRHNLDLVRATREGLPAEAAFCLDGVIRASEQGAPQSPLDALVAELAKAGDASRLTPEQSEIVVRTATVFAMAVNVLGGREKAAHWLKTPNRALGGEVPITLLDTSLGAHEVEKVLVSCLR